MTDTSLAAQDAAAGAVAVAPRVTLEDLEENILHTTFFTAAEGSIQRPGAKSAWMPLNLLTICVLVLRNGFTVVGHSACASPENFNAKLGQQTALRHAKEQIWPLMGYELRSRLAAESRAS